MLRVARVLHRPGVSGLALAHARRPGCHGQRAGTVQRNPPVTVAGCCARPAPRPAKPEPGARPDPELGQAPAPCLSVPARSEEHTSELKSLMRNSYADFCSNKKKK